MKIMEIDESSKRFWGMIVETGKKYSQMVEQDFSLTMACLENKTDTKNQYVQLFLQYENTEYLLCTLQHGQVLNQKLDMSFGVGEELTFSVNGPGNVHLTGYLLDNPVNEADNFEDDPDFDSTNADLSEEDYSDSEDEESEEEEDEDEDEEEEPELVPVGTKRKGNDIKASPKKLKGLNGTTTTDDSDDDSEDDDDDEEEEEEDFSDDTEGNSFLDDEAEEDSEEDSEEEDVKKPVTPKKKQTKEEKKTPKQNQTPKEKKTPELNKKTPKSTPAKQQAEKAEVETAEPNAGGDTETTSKKKKKKKKKNKNKDKTAVTVGIPSPNKQNGTPQPQDKKVNGQTPKPQEKKENGQQTPKNATTPKTPKKSVVQGGTTIEEIKVGHGPEATPGKMCGMYYAGTLQQGGKRFDSCLSGKPFRFKLGKGEVIKGWDAGVKGMRVGGKRKLTVPAAQAYGNQRLPGIPANSSLVFEVELKSVT